MRWSKLKQNIESKFAPSLKGRVELRLTAYRKAPDKECKASIVIDGESILNISNFVYWRESYYDGGGELGPDEATDTINVFSIDRFMAVLRDYLNLSMDEIVGSRDCLVKAIGMLDGRLGKRRLRTLDVQGETELVRRLWQLRCAAEGITPASEAATPLSGRIKTDAHSKRFKQEQAPPPDEVRASLLVLDNQTRRIRTLLHNLQLGQVALDEGETAVSRAIIETYHQTAGDTTFCQTLLFLSSRSALFDDSGCGRAAVEIARDHPSWRRDISRWQPRSKNSDKQLATLLRHLYADYEVPAFMDQAWKKANRQHQQWYKHIGAGKNIRTAEGIPVVLTKNMAHHFLRAPSHYEIEAAIRWAQIHALGGDQSLCDALLDTRLATDFNDDVFWQSVLRFFIRNPMLDTIWINPIVDYIWSEKYEDRIVFTARGVAENLGPAQANFTMQGRTVHALLRQVRNWHERLGRDNVSATIQWKKSAVPDFEFVEGSRESQNMRVFRVRELLSAKELSAEGKFLHHCVASYAGSCHRGLCTIWTLTVSDHEGEEKQLTIEVRTADLRIRQARGKYNRRPTPKEREIMQRWCDQSGVIMESYI
ncbi:MAG: PcfJ domain-containing protein [Cyanobacteria bacterium SZAS LIN-3]|nr:PcfJ domain-containing protein [Cyanobacteria bacterium SZAS LIN-3]MBS2009156.1 PcfJ domain-containing protein [Cyanobacteria bacterium SZAS TMP-1]